MNYSAHELTAAINEAEALGWPVVPANQTVQIKQRTLSILIDAAKNGRTAMEAEAEIKRYRDRYVR